MTPEDQITRIRADHEAGMAPTYADVEWLLRIAEAADEDTRGEGTCHDRHLS